MSYDNSPLPTPLTDVVERTPSLRRAYVLFMDIVNFSRLPTDHQVAAQTELSALVQNTAEVYTARQDPDSLIIRSTGDGMALLFFKDMLSPLRCALQVHGLLQADAARIKQLVGTPLKLRMGIHAGEVTIVQDVNGHNDAAGDGIITAQRVMDMGDADHILLSAEVAKVLLNMDPWARYINHLGEVRVKHKVLVDLYNLYGRLDGPFCGNPGTPRKVAEDGRARNREARAERPSVGDYLLPHRGKIVTLIFLAGLGYGGSVAVQKYPPARKLWVSVVGKIVPAKPKPKPTPKGNKPRPGGGSGGPTPPPAISGRPDKVKAPNLVGSETHDADAIAQSYGLVLKIVQGGYTKFPENTVYSQRPNPGTVVRTGGAITVFVSRGIKSPGSNDGGETTDPAESGDPGDKDDKAGDSGSTGGE
jgi:class 3 adenylate cyclase